MFRMSGKAKKVLAIIALALVPLAAVVAIADGSRGSSAAPTTLATSQVTRTPDNAIESSLWTDDRGAAWLKQHDLFSREGQTFVFKPYERLDWAIPVSLAYYDTAVTTPMGNPTSITVIEYYGDKPLTLPFPPPTAAVTCQYFIVLYVGLDKPKGPETPTNGDLTPPTNRVLYLANQETDPALKERCKPQKSRGHVQLR